MSDFNVFLVTLCGCHKEVEWCGLPPREIRVPIKRRFSFADQQEHAMPAESIRIRTFKMTESAHPFYRFDEEPEP